MPRCRKATILFGAIRAALQKCRPQLSAASALTATIPLVFWHRDSFSGDAVLGLYGTEKRLDYTTIGDSVNTARRIQEAAAPDQILISATAYELVALQVLATPVKPVHAKGKSVPLAVYEITGLRRA